MALKIRIKVETTGEAPYFRKYHARLEVGEQGFIVGPIYKEDECDDGPKQALWMATMLRKAIQRIIDEDCEIVQ